MLINECLKMVRPVYEDELDRFSGTLKNALINLKDYLTTVYDKGGSWKCGYVNPTASDVAQLYDVYKNIVHDHVKPEDIKTISQNVADCLGCLGFKLKVDEIGWSLTEETIKNTYKLIYKVSGIYDVYSPTEETADVDIRSVDFGDLSDVLWEKDSVEFTSDGKREDIVHVTYFVMGHADPVFVKAENEQSAKKQAEEILSTEDFGPIEDIEFECLSCEIKMNENWEMPPEYLDSLKKKIAKYKLPKWFETIVIDGGHYEVLDGKILDVYSAPDFVEITMDRYGDSVRWRVHKNGTIGER